MISLKLRFNLTILKAEIMVDKKLVVRNSLPPYKENCLFQGTLFLLNKMVFFNVAVYLFRMKCLSPLRPEVNLMLSVVYYMIGTV